MSEKEKMNEMSKYRAIFRAFVEVEAESEAEAIEKAWLQKNIDKATYRFISIRKEK